jgi:hypothetical protein
MELLNVARERNWIPVLLGWLNLHDRPAVQIEALLTLANIAEVCSSSSTTTSTTTSMVQQAAAAARAAAAAESLGKKFTLPLHHQQQQQNEANLPMSFSSTMTPEAMADFYANLNHTIQQQQQQQLKQQHSSCNSNTNNNSSSKTSSALSSLTSSLSQSLGLSSHGGVVSSSSSTHHAGGSYLPPPSTSMDMPKLSAFCQHLLLRHADAIPTLISLLNSDDAHVYQQSLWILGNIASNHHDGSASSSSSDNGKSAAARDVILAAGCMNPLLMCMEKHATNLKVQRLASWTLTNLVEGIFQTSSSTTTTTTTMSSSSLGNTKKNSSEYNSSDEVKMATLLPVLRRCLNHCDDAEVLSFTCWTLSHLCDGPSSHIAAVVTTPPHAANKSPRGGLVPRLVELLLHKSWRVTKPALRTIGNIVCAECGSSNDDHDDDDDDDDINDESTDYTQVIIHCGAVPVLKKLVTHNNREIQKEACWTLSNIAAGTVHQIQAVIDSGAIAPLVKLVSDPKTDQEVRSEACWVVLNATSCGSDSQIEVLVKEGCVSVLGVLLSEQSMVMMALEGLERVLQVEETREATSKHKGAQSNTTPMLVSASLIEKAQDKNNSTAVKKRADRIWKQHFVSCALCHESFSKHRTADATFCDECKCYVCSNCDCKQYHLSYQEELWAATEEKTEAKKNAKKSKNKKKKQKQKRAKQASSTDITSQQALSSSDNKVTVETSGKISSSQRNESSVESSSRKSRGGESTASDDAGTNKNASEGTKKKDRSVVVKSSRAGHAESQSDEELDIDAALDEQKQPPIDFVLYLQQTGSIIALAKLMDALEYGTDGNDYNDEVLDENDLKLIRASMQKQAKSSQ